MEFDELLDRLEQVRRRGEDRATARCPAHPDGRASLSVRRAPDGKILVKCFAGCTFQEVAAALGLAPRDFFPPRAGGGRR